MRGLHHRKALLIGSLPVAEITRTLRKVSFVRVFFSRGLYEVGADNLNGGDVPFP